MNEADSSPGNGAPAAAAAPAAPTANTPAPALDLDTLVARLSGVVDEKIKASQNATHAALRKAGVFKQEASEPAPASTPTAPASSGLSATDVEAMLERERVVASRAAKFNLSDVQTGRLKKALAGVGAESFASEADAFLADMGLAKAPTPAAPVAAPTATTPTEAPKPPAMAPAAPSGHSLPTQNGIVDLFSLTPQQLKDIGPTGVRQALEQFNTIGSQMAGIPQRPKPPSQR